MLFFLFFFNVTATTEIYTLSLHDALPILSRCARTRRAVHEAALTSHSASAAESSRPSGVVAARECCRRSCKWFVRSEEHTSELQSRLHLVCRLLLEKKKKKNTNI